MLPHVCLMLHLCMDPQSQYPGCVGCVGCAGMSGMDGQETRLAAAHQCLTSVWKQSTAWTQKLEVKTALVTYTLPKHPHLQGNYYLWVWRTQSSLRIQLSFSHSSELSDWILPVLACNNNQPCGMAQRSRRYREESRGGDVCAITHRQPSSWEKLAGGSF